MTLLWKRYPSTESLDDETSVEVTVLRKHWKFILKIFQKSFVDQDDISCVISHFQHAVVLLTNEVANQTRPGPVLLYFIAESLLDTFFIWSLSCPEYSSELKYYQLRCFESLLSQSQHELLFHKQIFKPLLNLLRSCESSTSSLEYLEKHMIIVLNQVCVSINRNADLLEFCFDISAQHGPSRFIIFSLLIPYVHRDGLAGQQARDALLLIMQLSHRNQSIARYIVENTDFCPILATGLSGLYSDLPHRLPYVSEDWFQFSKGEWSENAALVQMMNSLQFCNDVIEVAHSDIGHHLLQYIYHGFLVPVLGPSIYQDLHERPVKLSEFRRHPNTMDEMIAATAYLDLFLRTIHQPALLKVFLQFILCAKIDQISLLETLIQRIESTSKLGLVSLQLFSTLINLNCEDVMFRLIFMYLIPCQRHFIADVETYGESAERFLSLRPSFIDQEEEKSSNRSHQRRFAAYLEDAHINIRRCQVACHCWSASYDGENPSPETILGDSDLISLTSSISSIINEHSQSLTIKPSSNIAVSNDSGIHEDGLDFPSQSEVKLKSTFQLPDWLANNQPIPEELLGTHSFSTDRNPQNNEENEEYPRHSFYALSFIDFSEKNPDDIWSTDSLPIDSMVHQEIQTCVETFQVCLNQFRAMNEEENDFVDLTEVKDLLDQLIDQVDSSVNEENDEIDFDLDLLEKFWDQKKITLEEYLNLLDQLIKRTVPMKNAEQCVEEFRELVEQIENCRFPPSLSPSFDDSSSNSISNEPSNPILTNDLVENYTSNGDIGPFLHSIFVKLETMFENSLATNLLLTGIIARLSHYSQPLLHSFLLNHNLVLESNVKSLFQILTRLKMKIETISQTFNDFAGLVRLAEEKLFERENPVEIVEERHRSKSVERPSKRNRLWQFFRGRSQRRETSPDDRTSTNIALVERSSMKFHYEWENSRTRQFAYSAVIFSEFLKELAAITLEHSLGHVDD